MLMLKPENKYQKVGEIVATNDTKISPDTSAMEAALRFTSDHLSGAPVVDERGRFVGFLSEFDLLKAIETGKSLDIVKVRDVMSKDRIAVKDSTTLAEAAKIMEDKHLLNLPVESDGVITKTVTRHDVLRGWLGIGIGCEPGYEP